MVDISVPGERCGRATKAGKPCRNNGMRGKGTPCTTHATDLDRHYIELMRKESWESYQSGEKSGRMRYAHELERAARDAVGQEDFRLYTPDGRQIVDVDGYAYTWDWQRKGGKLEVGDRVHLAGGYSGGWDGTVRKLGSSYLGHLAEAQSRVG